MKDDGLHRALEAKLEDWHLLAQKWGGPDGPGAIHGCMDDLRAILAEHPPGDVRILAAGWRGVFRCSLCKQMFEEATHPHTYHSFQPETRGKWLSCEGIPTPFERRAKHPPRDSTALRDLLISWAIPLLEKALAHHGTMGQMLPCCSGHEKLTELKLLLTPDPDEKGERE